jgi:AMP-binding enzyme C-terminal domain
VESALVSHPRVAEAAVVGKPHEIKGEAIFAYVVCRGERPTGDTRAFVIELREWVSKELGAIAKPEEIRFADNLPKTRSGKIMRRLLRALARGEEMTQDVSTLENPAILDQLRGVESHRPAAAAAKSRRQPARRARSAAAKKTAERRPRKRKAIRPIRKAKNSAKKSAAARRSPRKRAPARKR